MKTICLNNSCQNKIYLQKDGHYFRKSKHKKSLKRLFNHLAPVLNENAIIRSDELKFYPEFIKKYCPGAKHERFKGIKGAVSGQGELKKTATYFFSEFDFSYI